jgi:hypothetical protein
VVNSSFYFAWVSSTETAFNASHLREDELIFSFELKHDEGQFAELSLEIANPHVGLLNPSRLFWAWFAWSDGSSVHPLFFGRLIAIPDDLFADVITIKLVAKPIDYAVRQMALANSLRVLPFYDPIFIDSKKLDDPNAVLEGYSALWHVDRITHAVTISDIIAGEDGIVEFSQNDAFYDNVSMKLAGAPLMVCEIDAEVDWTQCDHTGVIEFKTVSNLVGDANLGNGYNVSSGVASAATVSGGSSDPGQTTYTWDYSNPGGAHTDGEIIESGGTITVPFTGGFLTSQSVSFTPADKETGTGESYSISQSFTSTKEVPSGSSASSSTPTNMQVATEVQQDRKEVIHVRVLADLQPVLTEADEGDNIKQQLSMNSRDAVEAGAATPSDGVYFPTARGQQSVEYLLMVARAHLLAGSRVVAVGWECPFSKILGLSCRMNATIEDPRIPGGVALGKIVTYGMTGNGDSGQFLGNVTIHCAVGNGSSIVLANGTPDYVDEGYVDPGYQHYSGRLVAATTNDMAFEPLGYEAVGIQLPITADQVLVRHEFFDAGSASNELLSSGAQHLMTLNVGPIGDVITSPPADAVAASNYNYQFNSAVNKGMKPSWLELEFKPIQQISTNVDYDARVSPLVVPMQINLAASSTP